MMRSKEELKEKFINPGSKVAEVNQHFRELILLEVLLDNRKLLIGLHNFSYGDRFSARCTDCGGAMISVPVFPDRESPTEFKCSTCSKEEAS